MDGELNFILGSGERLTEPIPAPGRRIPQKDTAYSAAEARSRLRGAILDSAQKLAELPAAACPNDEAVAVLTLHPQFLAKSWYPGALLADARLRAVGSKGTLVTPEKWTRKKDPEPSVTTELFVAGKREDFTRWASLVQSADEASSESAQLVRVERVGVPTPSSRLKISDADLRSSTAVLEAVLHDGTAPNVLANFALWATECDAEADLDRRIEAAGLTFIPVRATTASLVKLARYSFLRVARSMPRLRAVRPTVVTRSGPTLRVDLPSEGPLDTDLRVAVFDGGLDPASPLSRWATPLDATGVGATDEESLIHGHRVTSALLFGSLDRSGVVPRPYAHVDHYRVLDDKSDTNPQDLFDVLPRILAVLTTKPYEYVSMSIGPCIAIEDDDVHAWTVALDEHLADGSTLLSVAVGNEGLADRESGNARIQPPADCVNALAVGATDRPGTGWARAGYSCVGPGRSPGLVKPDVVGFGGSAIAPFEVLDSDSRGRTVPTLGTSFAGPGAMRLALGARALLGSRLTPLAAKALLVHCSQSHANGHEDVGWGRVPEHLEDLVVCPDGSVRVLYQGLLDPAGYIRAQVPLPQAQLPGMVTVTATFAYATQVDGQHPDAYTRAGLDVVFRPHSGRLANEDGGTVAKSRPFFQLRQFSEESDLRADAHKWETVLHRSDRMRGSSLQAPVFDIHYNARVAGHPGRTFPRIRYAAVITVEAAREPRLYNKVLLAYPGQLQALVPVVDIPLRIGT